MNRKAEAPTRTALDDQRIHEWIETHPAYGAIGLSRVTGGIQLHGSNVQHNSFVELTISSAVRQGDAYHEYMHPRETLCKVRMTDTQFVALVSRWNGADVPCTLSMFRHGEMTLPPEILPLPKPAEVLEKISKDVHERLNKVTRERAAEIMGVIEGLPLKKRAKVQQLLEILIEHLTSNANYAMEVMTKRKDRLVMEAQVEIETTVSSMVTKLGLASAEQLAALMASDPAKVVKLLGHDDGSV